MFVTVELLDKLEACKDQRDRFAELFLRGVELTRELIVKHAQEFDWQWCAENLAGDEGLAAYRRATKPAYAAFQQTNRSAYAEYREAIKQSNYIYNHAIDVASTAFRRFIYQEESLTDQEIEQAHIANNQAFEKAGKERDLAQAPAALVYEQAVEQATATLNIVRANAFADAIGL